jgi:hypothetical protein
MDRRRWALVVTALVGVIGTLDSVLSLVDRWQGGINLGELVTVARLLSGPLALILVLLLWTRPGGNPHRVIRPEWDSRNQVEHWEGVRKMAIQAQSELRNATAKDVTVRDQSNLRNLVDSLDLQVSSYSDLWGRSSYWDERARVRWESDRGRYEPLRPDAPTWAQPLWERISYAMWWLSTHDPLSWEGDPGSW